VTEFFERHFAKEFRSLMMEYRAVTRLDIRKLPIPFKKPVLVEKLYVKGIEDERYSILNHTFVTKRAKNTIKRNIYRNNGEIKGETSYTAKEGNVLVVTEENLRLPFRYTPSDSSLEYVDYRVKDGVRSFIYSVPKKYLYKVQQTVLVLSQHSKRAHYGGVQIMLTNGHTVYLYIVGLKSIREAEGNVPLVMKTSIDYSKELNMLQQFWLSKGIIFPREMLDLETPIGGVTNLGYRVLEPTSDYVGIDEYSLEEREEMRKRSVY
jgi:hypothetical protein